MSSAVVVTVLSTFRPKFLTLTPVCILLGIAVALVTSDKLILDHAVLVLLGALSAQASVNAFNEYLDFKSGLDLITKRTPFSGGTGSLPAMPSAENYVLAGAMVTLFITIVIGLYLVSQSTFWLLLIGILGVMTILAYTRYINTMPWVCLIAPGAAFGPMFVLGSYFAVVPPDSITLFGANKALIVSLVPFFLVNNLLLLNQFPDVEADIKVGRKTFPIVYGLENSHRVLSLFYLLTALAVLGPVLFGLTHWLSLIALFPLLIGFSVVLDVKRANYVTHDILPAMGKNVGCVLLTTLFYALGILMSKLV